MSDILKRSYNGNMMEEGNKNENIIIYGLQKNHKTIIDVRKNESYQKDDIDIIIKFEDEDDIFLEIKSDQYINEKNDGNFLIENHRINHFASIENMFYVGWFWRTKADKLIIRNPNIKKETEEDNTFVFDIYALRKFIGKYLGNYNLKIEVKRTDISKSTYYQLISMKLLKKQNLYESFFVDETACSLIFGRKNRYKREKRNNAR